MEGARDMDPGNQEASCAQKITSVPLPDLAGNGQSFQNEAVPGDELLAFSLQVKLPIDPFTAWLSKVPT